MVASFFSSFIFQHEFSFCKETILDITICIFSHFQISMCWGPIFNSHGLYLEVGFLGHIIILHVHSLMNFQMFSKMIYHFTFSFIMCKYFIFICLPIAVHCVKEIMRNFRYHWTLDTYSELTLISGYPKCNCSMPIRVGAYGCQMINRLLASC